MAENPAEFIVPEQSAKAVERQEPEDKAPEGTGGSTGSSAGQKVPDESSSPSDEESDKGDAEADDSGNTGEERVLSEDVQKWQGLKDQLAGKEVDSDAADQVVQDFNTLAGEYWAMLAAKDTISGFWPSTEGGLFVGTDTFNTFRRAVIQKTWAALPREALAPQVSVQWRKALGLPTIDEVLQWASQHNFRVELAVDEKGKAIWQYSSDKLALDKLKSLVDKRKEVGDKAAAKAAELAQKEQKEAPSPQSAKEKEEEIRDAYLLNRADCLMMAHATLALAKSSDKADDLINGMIAFYMNATGSAMLLGYGSLKDARNAASFMPSDSQRNAFYDVMERQLRERYGLVFSGGELTTRARGGSAYTWDQSRRDPIRMGMLYHMLYSVSFMEIAQSREDQANLVVRSNRIAPGGSSALSAIVYAARPKAFSADDWTNQLTLTLTSIAQQRDLDLKGATPLPPSEISVAEAKWESAEDKTDAVGFVSQWLGKAVDLKPDSD